MTTPSIIEYVCQHISTSCCWYCMFFGQTTALATRAAESKVWISMDLHLVGLGYVFWFRWRFQTVLPNNAPTGIRFLSVWKTAGVLAQFLGLGNPRHPMSWIPAISGKIDGQKTWETRETQGFPRPDMIFLQTSNVITWSTGKYSWVGPYLHCIISSTVRHLTFGGSVRNGNKW